MGKLTERRGEILLGAIHDEVNFELNPSGDDCPNCGGEGYIHDCIDGCCMDADSGCEICERRCSECVRFRAAKSHAVRKAVLQADDIDIATAWLKEIGRWTPDITPERIKTELAAGRAALSQHSEGE